MKLSKAMLSRPVRYNTNDFALQEIYVVQRHYANFCVTSVLYQTDLI